MNNFLVWKIVYQIKITDTYDVICEFDELTRAIEEIRKFEIEDKKNNEYSLWYYTLCIYNKEIKDWINIVIE